MGAAQIHVVYRGSTEQCDLRYYGSDEFVVPMWWLGITNPSGELVRTDVFPGARKSTEDVLSWLRQIVGAAVAEQLVLQAREATVALTKRETAAAS